MTHARDELLPPRGSLRKTYQAYWLAVLELGRQEDPPRVRNLLRRTIKDIVARGGGDCVSVAHAAVDEVVLITCGEVQPAMPI